jgi:hypothetical protein
LLQAHVIEQAKIFFFKAERYESRFLPGDIRSCYGANERFTLDVNNALIECILIKARDVVINIHGENGDVLFQQCNEMPLGFVRSPLRCSENEEWI